MKNIVTGASGFIGSNLVQKLLNDNQKIIGIDKDYNAKYRLLNVLPKNSEIPSRIVSDINKNFMMIWQNIKHIMDYHYSFEKDDIVYHLAASSDIQRSLRDTSWDFKNNIKGTYEVLEMMRRKDISKIIFSSTSALYGEKPKKRPTPENSTLFPLSLYASSKICAEFLIQAYCELYGIKAYIFRFGNVIGRNQHRGVVYDFVKKLKKNTKQLEILGNGNQVKSYFHVSDCVNAMLEIPNWKMKDKFRIYNIATYDWINVTTVADVVCNELKLNPKYVYTGGDRGWKGDIPKITLDISKALKTGWKPKYYGVESIRKAVREIK